MPCFVPPTMLPEGKGKGVQKQTRSWKPLVPTQKTHSENITAGTSRDIWETLAGWNLGNTVVDSSSGLCDELLVDKCTTNSTSPINNLLIMSSKYVQPELTAPKFCLCNYQNNKFLQLSNWGLLLFRQKNFSRFRTDLDTYLKLSWVKKICPIKRSLSGGFYSIMNIP